MGQERKTIDTTATSPSVKRLCIGMILLQSILYGGMDPLAKIVYQEVPIYCFLLVRYLIATSFFLLLFHKTILADLRRVPIRHYLFPCFGLAMCFVLSHAALSMTAATTVAFLRSLSGPITTLLLVVFMGKRFRWYHLLVQGVILVGLYLLCAKGGLSSFGIGEILALLAATCVAVSLAFGSRALGYVNAVTLSCVQSACSILLCSAGILVTKSTVSFSLLFSPISLGSLLYAALGCTVGGYLMQNYALTRISAKTVGVAQCTYPIVTMVIAYFMLGELLSPLGLFGAGLILAMVLVEGILKE